ncbi:SAM-dependent methyltransferase [Streptomyces sp. NPDC001275]
MTTDEDGSPCAGGDPYAPALRAGHGPVYLRLGNGHPVWMPVHRWYAHPTLADESVLNRCIGPVLDVRCGPGRLCRALLSRGVFALGVDVTPPRGGPYHRSRGIALCRSIFDQLPAEGGWQTVLLIDGNIGIGGDPRALLGRCIQLTAPTGFLLVGSTPTMSRSSAPPGSKTPMATRACRFPWAHLGAPALHRIAEDLTLNITDQWRCGHRRFLALGRQDSVSEPR